jgi:deoxyribonucleoside regulator
MRRRNGPKLSQDHLPESGDAQVTERPPRQKRRSYAKTEEELIYLAAWLHYQQNKAQKDIAKILGIKNPSTISRWLQKAISNGVVAIQLRPPGLSELALRLSETFALSHALVIPTLPQPSADDANRDDQRGEREDTMRLLQAEELGVAAAKYLSDLVKGNQGIGLGGGTSVAAFVRHWPGYAPRVGFRLYALGASSREPLELSSPGVAAIACGLLNAGFRQRAPRDGSPPILVEAHALRLPQASESKEILEREAEIYYERAMNDISMVITGIGALHRDWVVTAEELSRFKRQGAVGEILLDFFGERGRPIEASPATTATIFPFGIKRLEKMVAKGKQVIVITSKKVEALRHALSCKDKFITGVITDEDTANRVLQFHAQYGSGKA